jgi:alkylation response protein AidB-like acyl-CoA dehydrogenase
MTAHASLKPRPLLRKAFPPNGLSARENELLAVLDQVIEADIAPAAAAHDEQGRYPTKAAAALKRSGVLRTAVPMAYGGAGFSSRFSLEVQVRLSIADSAVAQIFKIHDELTRELFVYSPAEFRPALARKLLDDNAILGLAVAESGRKVDDPWKTVAMPQADGSFLIDGQKIYTTGAAEADYIVAWAFNPQVEGIAANPLLGVQGNLVPANTAGVTIHRDWDAIGQRATDSGTITFKNVKTKPDWKCSISGQAPLHASLRYQAGFAAVLIGLGIGALRAAIPFITSKSRPWPSAGVDTAADDPFVRRLTGELTADLAAAYALTLATGDLLDAHERGEIDRTALAAPIYAAKAAASRAGVRATSEIFALMGTRSAARAHGFDRFWRNARTVSLHDPVDWKHSELGQHVLTGWDPPPGIYQ